MKSLRILLLVLVSSTIQTMMPSAQYPARVPSRSQGWVSLDARLALAVTDGDFDDASSLLEGGANPNAQESGVPIFLFALTKPEIAKLFMNKRGFNPNAVDPQTGMSALASAININSEDSLETAKGLLWKPGINVNIKDKFGLTPLDYAESVTNPNAIIIRLLEGLGAKRGKEINSP